MTVKAIQETCSVCGHGRFYHEKGIFDCVVGGVSDAAGGHSFAGTQRALWSSFVPFEIPVPLVYVPIENDVLDSGGFSADGTVTNNELYADDFAGVANGAFDFDDTSYVTLTDADEQTIPFDYNTPFSFQFWAKVDVTVTSGFPIIISAGTSTGWQVFWNKSSTLMAFKILSTGSVHNWSVSTVTTEFPAGVWSHFLCTYNGKANRTGMKVYQDGILKITGTDDPSDGDSFTQNQPITLGAFSGGANDWKGQASEFAIWDTELSADQVAFLYNSASGRRLGFNLRNGLLLKADFNGNTTDDATTPNTLTVTGTEQYTTGLAGDDGIGVQAFDFDGATYLKSDNEANFDITATTKMTMSVWFKTTTTGVFQWLAGKNDSLSGATNGYATYVSSGSPFLKLMEDSGNTLQQESSQNDRDDGEWHHQIAMWRGTALESGITIVSDGVIDNSISGTAVLDALTNAHLFSIGAQEDGGTPWTGQMQQVCFWNRNLSDAEITFLYNGGKPLGF